MIVAGKVTVSTVEWTLAAANETAVPAVKVTDQRPIKETYSVASAIGVTVRNCTARQRAILRRSIKTRGSGCSTIFVFDPVRPIRVVGTDDASRWVSNSPNFQWDRHYNERTEYDPGKTHKPGSIIAHSSFSSLIQNNEFSKRLSILLIDKQDGINFPPEIYFVPQVNFVPQQIGVVVAIVKHANLYNANFQGRVSCVAGFKRNSWTSRCVSSLTTSAKDNATEISRSFGPSDFAIYSDEFFSCRPTVVSSGLWGLTRSRL